MDERERIIREVIKVLPELFKSLRRDVALHRSEGSDMAGLGPQAQPLTTGQMRTLVHLAQYGLQSMGELADGMQITTASATGLVKPLVAMGYVTRSRDPRDERMVRVALSEQAQALAERILAHRRREVEEALTGMDDEACRHFLEGLERLAGRRR
jgi:DNA-binding MarR family transcriptional regulator